MINIKELRVGNLVLNNEVEYETITGFILGKYEEVEYFPFKPIPLNEEWLIKAGFEHVKESIILKSYILNYSRDRYISVSDVATPNMMIWHGYRTETEHDVINIWNWDYDKNIHVHQLQNIVFALTGTELTFKDL